VSIIEIIVFCSHILQLYDVTDALMVNICALHLSAGVLKRLDLSNNNLSGDIPSVIGQLQGASVSLTGNDFHGSNSSTSTIAPLSLCMRFSVDKFDLADNTTL